MSLSALVCTCLCRRSATSPDFYSGRTAILDSRFHIVMVWQFGTIFDLEWICFKCHFMEPLFWTLFWTSNDSAHGY